MRATRARMTALGGILALSVVATGCDALRDTEPFTITIAYERVGERLVIDPIIFLADNSFGQVQIDNQTDEERGFAIDELAVYEVIPARQTKTIGVDEAEDGLSYQFYDHKHPREFRGTMRVKYEDESRR